jgi:hypothetical protein
MMKKYFIVITLCYLPLILGLPILPFLVSRVLKDVKFDVSFNENNANNANKITGSTNINTDSKTNDLVSGSVDINLNIDVNTQEIKKRVTNTINTAQNTYDWIVTTGSSNYDSWYNNNDKEN